MIIDGREISKELISDLKKRVSGMIQVPMLIAIQVGDDPATESFIKIKRRVAEKIGVAFEAAKLDKDVTTEDLIDRIEAVSKDELVRGVIVQLPLPGHIDTGKVLNSIPKDKDPDVLSIFAREEKKVFAPVAEAAREVLKRGSVSLENKSVLVIGEGRLVGGPIIDWLKSEGVRPVVANDETANLKELSLNADVIFSGAGSPGLIKDEMVKEGVVIIDAGTSEEGGLIKGDADEGVREKASLITPVPGGMGPIVVAKLFENLISLIETKNSN